MADKSIQPFLIGLSFDSLFIYLERMLIAADVNSSENFSVLGFVRVHNFIRDFYEELFIV